MIKTIPGWARKPVKSKEYTEIWPTERGWMGRRRNGAVEMMKSVGKNINLIEGLKELGLYEEEADAPESTDGAEETVVEVAPGVEVAPAEDPEPEADVEVEEEEASEEGQSKVWTEIELRATLEAGGMEALRKIGDAEGVKAKGGEKLIAAILEAQG